MRWLAIGVCLLWSCGDDVPAPAAGDACDQTDTLACAGRRVLQCDAERYAVVHTCPGQQACAVWTGDRVGCGTEILRVLHAVSGAPCAGDGAQVCDFSRDRVLECIDGYWTATTECGPDRCVSGGEPNAPGAACAAGGLSAGERCQFEAGLAACSTDGGAVLICSGGEAIVDEDCAADGRQCAQMPCADDVCIGCR